MAWNRDEVGTDGEGTVSHTEDSSETEELAKQVDSMAEEWTFKFTVPKESLPHTDE